MGAQCQLSVCRVGVATMWLQLSGTPGNRVVHGMACAREGERASRGCGRTVLLRVTWCVVVVWLGKVLPSPLGQLLSTGRR